MSSYVCIPRCKGQVVGFVCHFAYNGHDGQLYVAPGILLLFLPPYSPGLNPIEMFSYVKFNLKDHNDILQVLIGKWILQS